MNLYATDKEYKERFDYFLEEVKNDDGNNLKMIDSITDDKTVVSRTNETIDLYQ